MFKDVPLPQLDDGLAGQDSGVNVDGETEIDEAMEGHHPAQV